MSDRSGGMLEPGNIDLFARPMVKNADGSISTVRSMSFEDENGVEVLVPTVSDDGRIMEDREAWDQYVRTGRHLGKFRTPDAATEYAKRLHDQQDRLYNSPPERRNSTMAGTWDSLRLGSMDNIGRVDIRGATPPIGNTMGMGGSGNNAANMGLMALLRRLSMGMDDRGPDELPSPRSPDPAASNSMAAGMTKKKPETELDWRGAAENAAGAASDWRSSPLDVLTSALGGVRRTEKDMEATGQPAMDPMMDNRGGMSPTTADMAATGQPNMMPLDQIPPMPPAPMPGGMPPAPMPGAMPGGMGAGGGMMPPVPMSKPAMGGMGMPAGNMLMGGEPEMTPEMMRMIYEQEMARLNGTGAGY